eukprot:GEZU01021156.1.p1 GENE.GEZU01021156.1~~GEZU01021156.1.p1  ORF type:complete len:393 (+),score=108.09 GEZU01021156.1:302-1480(+)
MRPRSGRTPNIKRDSSRDNLAALDGKVSTARRIGFLFFQSCFTEVPAQFVRLLQFYISTNLSALARSLLQLIRSDRKKNRNSKYNSNIEHDYPNNSVGTNDSNDEEHANKPTRRQSTILERIRFVRVLLHLVLQPTIGLFLLTILPFLRCAQVLVHEKLLKWRPVNEYERSAIAELFQYHPRRQQHDSQKLLGEQLGIVVVPEKHWVARIVSRIMGVGAAAFTLEDTIYFIFNHASDEDDDEDDDDAEEETEDEQASINSTRQQNGGLTKVRHVQADGKSPELYDVPTEEDEDDDEEDEDLDDEEDEYEHDDTLYDKELLRHETVHVLQFREHGGIVPFLSEYFAQFLSNLICTHFRSIDEAYRAIPAEIEAYRLEKIPPLKPRRRIAKDRH